MNVYLSASQKPQNERDRWLFQDSRYRAGAAEGPMAFPCHATEGK
jgi:hypothetical protein